MRNPLSFIFKAAPDRRPADTPPEPTIMYLGNGAGAMLVSHNQVLGAEAAMAHPIVRRALDKIASSVQTVKWFAEEDPDARSSDRRSASGAIKDLNDLLRSPNDIMTSAQLRYWLGLNLALYDRAPFKVSKSATRAGRPNGIFAMETQYVKIDAVNRGGAVTRYKYGNGENSTTIPGRVAANETQSFADEVWRPSIKPTPNTNCTTSLLSSVSLPAGVIKALLHRAIATAEGHPNVRYMVITDSTLNEGQRTVLKRHLEGHDTNGQDSGRIAVLRTSARLDIEKLDNDLSDIHSKMPSDDMARLIFGAYGIPIALAGMGAADGAKFAGNYIESRAAFWEDTIVPSYLMPIGDAMTRALCPKGARISFDLDSIQALMHSRITSMKEASAVTFLTDNEKREMFGFDQTGTPEQRDQTDDDQA